MNFEACPKNLRGQTYQRSEVGYIRCCLDSLMIIYPPKIDMSRRREPFQKEISCSNHWFSGFQGCTCYDHVTYTSLFQPTQVKIGIINHMSDLPKTPLTRTKHPQMTLVWLLCCCLFFWKQGAFQIPRSTSWATVAGSFSTGTETAFTGSSLAVSFLAYAVTIRLICENIRTRHVALNRCL